MFTTYGDAGVYMYVLSRVTVRGLIDLMACWWSFVVAATRQPLALLIIF